jgi:hypothetical protein
VQADWLHTQYGFAYLRERQLAPATQAFMAELRAVEDALLQLAADLQPMTSKPL